MSSVSLDASGDPNCYMRPRKPKVWMRSCHHCHLIPFPPFFHCLRTNSLSTLLWVNFLFSFQTHISIVFQSSTYSLFFVFLFCYHHYHLTRLPFLFTSLSHLKYSITATAVNLCRRYILKTYVKAHKFSPGNLLQTKVI